MVDVLNVDRTIRLWYMKTLLDKEHKLVVVQYYLLIWQTVNINCHSELNLRSGQLV